MIYLFMSLLSRDTTITFNKVVLGYAFFVLLAFSSTFWALNFDLVSLKSAQLLLILINLLIIYNAVVKYNLEKAFITGVILASFVNFIFLFGIVQAPFEIFTYSRAMGTLGNANLLALTMVMSILLSIVYLYRYKSSNKFILYYQYVNIFLAIYVIVLTASKKGILFGSVLVLVYFLLSLKNPKYFFRFGILGTVIIALLVNFIDLEGLLRSFELVQGRFEAFGTELQGTDRTGSTAQRLEFIKIGLSHFSSGPFLGHGIDTFRIYGGTYSHNNFIEVLFGLGMLGLLAFYAMYMFTLSSIFYMKDTYLKVLLLVVIVNMLVVDMALVSYGDKLYIYMVLFISILAEKGYSESSDRKAVDAKKD